MSCSGVEDPRSTELTPSFLRHHAGKKAHTVRMSKHFLLIGFQIPPVIPVVAIKTFGGRIKSVP